MALFIVGNLVGQLGHEGWPFGTRADKSHLSAQDVPKLRNLVHADLANYPAHSGHPIVVLAGPDGPVLFVVDSHPAKLCQDKRPSLLSNSLLLIEDRTTRFEFNEDRCQYHDRKR